MDAALVFGAQFVMIFLLGIQSLNVNGKHYVSAAITSALLGVFGFYLTGTIAAAHQQGMFSVIWWSFVTAGPLGIITSMKLHPVLVRWFR